MSTYGSTYTSSLSRTSLSPPLNASRRRHQTVRSSKGKLPARSPPTTYTIRLNVRREPAGITHRDIKDDSGQPIQTPTFHLSAMAGYYSLLSLVKDGLRNITLNDTPIYTSNKDPILRLKQRGSTPQRDMCTPNADNTSSIPLEAWYHFRHTMDKKGDRLEEVILDIFAYIPSPPAIKSSAQHRGTKDDYWDHHKSITRTIEEGKMKPMGLYEKQWAAYTLSKERAPIARHGTVPNLPNNVTRQQMQHADKAMGHTTPSNENVDRSISLMVTFSSREELIRILNGKSLPTPDPPLPGKVRSHGSNRPDPLQEEAHQLLSRLESHSMSGRNQSPQKHRFSSYPYLSPSHKYSKLEEAKELSTYKPHIYAFDSLDEDYDNFPQHKPSSQTSHQQSMISSLVVSTVESSPSLPSLPLPYPKFTDYSTPSFAQTLTRSPSIEQLGCSSQNPLVVPSSPPRRLPLSALTQSRDHGNQQKNSTRQQHHQPVVCKKPGNTSSHADNKENEEKGEDRQWSDESTALVRQDKRENGRKNLAKTTILCPPKKVPVSTRRVTRSMKV